MTRPVVRRPAPPRRRWLGTARLARLVLVSSFLLGAALPWTRGDDSPLAVADLADYRRALIARDPEPPPALVHFRELWDHPARYAGKRVQVEGRIVRRFRQGAFGTFPPLVEAWAVTPSGDTFCWVYPAPEKQAPSPTVQEDVRFVGTYLKRIRYQGGDVERLAPLIVGPHPPSSPRRAGRAPDIRSSFGVGDWILGITAAVVVIAVIGWQHLRKPVSRAATFDRGTTPQFDPPRPETPVPDGTQDASNDDKGAGPG